MLLEKIYLILLQVLVLQKFGVQADLDRDKSDIRIINQARYELRP